MRMHYPLQLKALVFTAYNPDSNLIIWTMGSRSEYWGTCICLEGNNLCAE